jgi:hypothetical protein
MLKFEGIPDYPINGIESMISWIQKYPILHIVHASDETKATLHSIENATES